RLALGFRAAITPPILDPRVHNRRAARGPRSAGTTAASLTSALMAAENDPRVRSQRTGLGTGSSPTDKPASRAARRPPSHATPPARPPNSTQPAPEPGNPAPAHPAPPQQAAPATPPPAPTQISRECDHPR